MPETRTILGIVLTVALAWLFWRMVERKRRRDAAQPARLFAEVVTLLENTQIKSGEAAGTSQLDGTYRGKAFQLKSITDTLAARKLPSLWFLVTLPEPQPISNTIDLMMRPQGPSTFSNFDFLPHTLEKPDAFPADAVVRSDSTEAEIPKIAIQKHLDFFCKAKGKEILISPKGLRVVFQAAEADRARYGVFREANFAENTIPADLALKAMDMLLAISHDLRNP